MVSTTVWYAVGAYDEPVGKTGISHMLEHMTFKHTDAYTPGTFHRMIKEAGGRSNGFTSTYYTAYYETFASDRWEFSLELEASRMATCRFDEEEFASEHQVVTEEWRLGQNRPTRKLWTEYEAVAFLAHPLRTPVIGWGDDIAHYTCAAVEDWYHRHYNPANAVLVIAGDVRPGPALAKVKKHFGPLKGTPVARTDFYDIEPEQTGERRLVLRRNTTAPALLVGYHVPGIRETTDYYAAELIEGILLQGLSSRLHRVLTKETGLAAWVGGGNYVSRDPAQFTISVTPKTEQDIPEIERVIEEELEKLKTEPVTDRELEKVHNQVQAEQVFNQDDPWGIAYRMARYHITTGSWRFMEQYPQGIRQVTTDHIQDFARRFFRPENRTVAQLLGMKEEK